MINTNRIVPVTATDLIALYGTIMKLAGTSVTAVEASTTNGEFNLTTGSGNFLANEPVKKFTFGSSVTSAVIYFIAAYDYEGFVIGETPTATTGATVDPDGKTLYSATLSSGSVTIAKVGF
jgi:hypothetical protein